MNDKIPKDKALLSSQVLLERLPSRHYKQIGKFVCVFSSLETTVDFFLMKILNITLEQSRILFKKTQIGTKIELAKALSKDALVESDFKIADKILENIKLIIPHRNFVMHGLWSRDEYSLEPIAFSLKPNAPLGEMVGQTYTYDIIEQLIFNSLFENANLHALIETSL